jgi:hypothetical protein
MLAEFYGKGDRSLAIANSKEKKAVGRKQESASNKRIVDCGIPKHGYGDGVMSRPSNFAS